ncbi:hypothetical protein P3T23_002254 [Paraburkholderia sp. GAS448]
MSLRWPSQPKSAPLQNMGVSRLNLNVFLRKYTLGETQKSPRN